MSIHSKPERRESGRKTKDMAQPNGKEVPKEFTETLYKAKKASRKLLHKKDFALAENRNLEVRVKAEREELSRSHVQSEAMQQRRDMYDVALSALNEKVPVLAPIDEEVKLCIRFLYEGWQNCGNALGSCRERFSDYGRRVSQSERIKDELWQKRNDIIADSNLLFDGIWEEIGKLADTGKHRLEELNQKVHRESKEIMEAEEHVKNQRNEIEQLQKGIEEHHYKKEVIVRRLESLKQTTKNREKEIEELSKKKTVVKAEREAIQSSIAETESEMLTERLLDEKRAHMVDTLGASDHLALIRQDIEAKRRKLVEVREGIAEAKAEAEDVCIKTVLAELVIECSKEACDSLVINRRSSWY